MRTKSIITIWLSIICLTLTAFPQTQSKPSRVNETYSALAYLPRGAGRAMVAPGATANLTINIYSYTPEAEAVQLRKILLEQGPDELYKQLGKIKAKGKISLSGHVGSYNLKWIRSIPTDNGRRILAVADRPIGFLEAYYSGRSRDYTFGMLQLDLEVKDKDEEKAGKKKEQGQGTLIYAAKVKLLESNKVEIENYGIEPIRLMSVRRL